MKIVKITTEVKSIELKVPFKTALREAYEVSFVRVSVEYDSGFVVYGEAPATKAITGEDIDDILESIKSVRESFIGLAPKECIEILHTKKIGSSAKAALDMAFVTLMAKEKNIALYDYFGAKDLSPLKTDITISLNGVSVMLADAKKAFSQGFDILKVKVGSDIKDAIEIVSNISQELSGVKIVVDANQAWDLQGSLEFIDAMGSFEIELIEQPVVASDLESLKKITAYSQIPILADEAVFSLEDAKNVIEQKYANMINIKLMKCGGVTKACEILEYARKNGVKCMLGSMLEGPYSINIALHLAFAYRDIIKYIDLDSPLLYKTMPEELDFEFRGCEISKSTQ